MASSTTTHNMNLDQLALGPIKERIPKNPVSDNLPRYEQEILYDGRKLSIQIPPVELYSIVYKNFIFGDSVVIPVSPWLRSMFNLLDTFVSNAVTVPQQLLLQAPQLVHPCYKPIYNGSYISIALSKWCRFTQTVNGCTTSVPSNPLPTLGMGRYSFTLDVCHVYMGPHKSGHLYSINFRIAHVHFEPCAVSKYLPQPFMAQTTMSQPVMSQPSMTQPPPSFSPATMTPPDVLSSPKEIVRSKSASHPGVLPAAPVAKPTRGRRRKHVVSSE